MKDIPANVRHIIPISGKDSLATAIWQMAREPKLPYEFIFNDTRAEMPETYAWLDHVEETLGIKIIRVGKSLKQIIKEQEILPSPQIRFCTKYAKIFPMNQFIGRVPAVVYFGLRADEPDRIGAFGTKYLHPSYPLRESGIGLAMVYRIVGDRGLLPPSFFWQRLFDEVMLQMGAVGGAIVSGWQQWQQDRVFAWRSRPNCFFCFFQRQYEWVGLLWNYPELFAEAEAIESTAGTGPQMRRQQGFTWVQDYPLSKIRQNAETIFRKRVEVVCRLIDRQRQGELFEASVDEMEKAGTSCGLLCGK